MIVQGTKTFSIDEKHLFLTLDNFIATMKKEKIITEEKQKVLVLRLVLWEQSESIDLTVSVFLFSAQ